MPWYGWYSARQEKLFGYAHYQNKKGNLVCITKVSQDQNFKHHYKDSVYQGELTLFIGVQKWNHTNKRAQEAKDNIIPANGPTTRYGAVVAATAAAAAAVAAATAAAAAAVAAATAAAAAAEAVAVGLGKK